MTASLLTVAWKDTDYHYQCKQQRFSDPLFHYGDIFHKAETIFDGIYHGGAVKYLGMSLGDLSSERDIGMTLFGRDRLKDERLSETVFSLKKRYGKQVITTARSLGSGVDRLFRHFDEDDFDNDIMPRFY